MNFDTSLSVHVVRSKWKNLRDTYRREKKKLLSKKQLRKKKKPWTYTAHMSFIDPFVDVRKSLSEEDSESETNRTCDDGLGNDMCDLNEEGEQDSSVVSIPPGLDRPIKQEIPEDEGKLVPKFSTFRRRKRMVGTVVGLQSSPLIKKLKPSPKVERRSYEMNEENDDDNITCFSKHIASELRLIKDPNMLALAKYKISQALFEAQLGVLAISASSPREQSAGPSLSHSVFPNIVNSTPFPTPSESYDSTSTCNGSDVIVMHAN